MNFSRLQVETGELGQRIFLALLPRLLRLHAAVWRTQKDVQKRALWVGWGICNLELPAIKPIQVPVSLLRSRFLDLVASSYL